MATRAKTRPSCRRPGRLSPARPLPPCLVCGEPREWAAGPEPGTFLGVCHHCEALAEDIARADRGEPIPENDGGGRNPSDCAGGRLLGDILAAAEGLRRGIVRFLAAHTPECRCPLCRYNLDARRQLDVLELLALLRTTLKTVRWQLVADLPCDLDVQPEGEDVL